MAPVKRLNLSKSRDDDESSSISSSGDEKAQPQKMQTGEEMENSSSDEGSDDEFEIPPGFESVQSSGSITREEVMTNDDLELWFFKLPKNLEASALANVTIKVNENATDMTPGKVLAKVTAGEEEDKKQYLLQSEDRMLTDQLVNALPLGSNRARYVLGKPFSRCFSLVEDHADASPIVSKKQLTDIASASPVVEKRKKLHKSEKHKSEKHKAKKAKHKQ